MSDGRVFDASAQIPATAPPDCDGVLGYIGPDPEATHVWTLEEWLRFSHLRQFPAWVAAVGQSDSASEGTAQGAAAAEAAAALGWHHGRLIFCDLEAWADPAYWAAWRAEVERHGYRAGWYGSKLNSADYPCEFRILASPDGVETVPDGFEGKQYQWDVHVNGGVVDFSVFSRKLMEHGGEGPRHG